jgi:hypothetical protein
MALREITRAVISLVEKTSGCPVVVSEDASLKTLAASRIARGANRIYSISFNPLAVRKPDYLICYQCGFILRLFGIPAADRVDLAGRRRGVKACIGFLALSSRFKSSRNLRRLQNGVPAVQPLRSVHGNIDAAGQEKKFRLFCEDESPVGSKGGVL